MAKGLIYITETIVPGLIKIGKAGTDQFESRMYSLEHNGYYNVTGLKRRFAIEVEDFDEKETLVHNLFDKSRIGTSELFAVDIDLVIQLLSSFEGRQIFPTNETKEAVFRDATEKRKDAEDRAKIPDGEYFLEKNVKSFGEVKATMLVEQGKFILKKGSDCCPCDKANCPAYIKDAPKKNNKLLEDVECTAPSAAAWVTGHAENGWRAWKTASGKPIDIFRKS